MVTYCCTNDVQSYALKEQHDTKVQPVQWIPVFIIQHTVGGKKYGDCSANRNGDCET